ncbi:uncharacterized protein LOC144860869 [Branchiostoma floridae x Branchiostoma japonicum]
MQGVVFLEHAFKQLYRCLLPSDLQCWQVGHTASTTQGDDAQGPALYPLDGQFLLLTAPDQYHMAILKYWTYHTYQVASTAFVTDTTFPTTTADTTVPTTTTMQQPATNALTSETSTAQVSGNQGGTQGVSCGQTTLLAGSGYVTSPNYPDGYPDNLFCNYHITATTGKIVLIRFIGKFEVESDDNGGCEYDYITVVLDGSETLGTYCSSREPPSDITGTTVDVRLRTDFSVSRRGFRLRYEAVDSETLSTCEAMSTVTVSGVERILTSPMFPDNYPNDLSCSWTFLAPPDKFVEVRFLTLYLEEDNRCRYDQVFVLIEGVETSNGPYCTTNEPSGAFYGKSVTVKFITDSSVADQGFEMTYQSVEGVASGTCTNKDLVPCSDKRCIPSLWRCDDVWDCNDGADERDCPFPSHQTTEIPTTPRHATSPTNTAVRSQTTPTQMSSSAQPTQRSTYPGATAVSLDARRAQTTSTPMSSSARPTQRSTYRGTTVSQDATRAQTTPTQMPSSVQPTQRSTYRGTTVVPQDARRAQTTSTQMSSSTWPTQRSTHPGTTVSQHATRAQTTSTPVSSSAQPTRRSTHSGATVSQHAKRAQTTSTQMASSTQPTQRPTHPGNTVSHNPTNRTTALSLSAPKKWREDYRCGKGHPAEDGNPAECDHGGIHPCCSPANWCGNTADHCDCPDCVDYRNTVLASDRMHPNPCALDLM